MRCMCRDTFNAAQVTACHHRGSISIAVHVPQCGCHVNVAGGFNKFMGRAYDLPQGETVLSTFGEPFGMQIHIQCSMPASLLPELWPIKWSEGQCTDMHVTCDHTVDLPGCRPVQELGQLSGVDAAAGVSHPQATCFANDQEPLLSTLPCACCHLHPAAHDGRQD